MAWPPESAELPRRVAEIVESCLAGRTPANVALMQVLAECEDPAKTRRMLEAAATRAEDTGRLVAMLRYWDENPGAWETVRAVLRDVDHRPSNEEPSDTVRRIATSFDKAVRLSPEGSVALYSLGSLDLLSACTAEIAGFVQDQALTGADRSCLDLGCGIGRMEQALAPAFRELVGVDVSAEMIGEARRRLADVPNVRFEQVSGVDLAGLADASFDVVLAIDSFPYLMQAGPDLARTMTREAARVLRPGGTLLVMNFSYRGDRAADQRDATDFAAGASLLPPSVISPTFRYWDGLVFRFDRPT